VAFSSNISNIKLWLESFTDAQLFNPAIYFLSTLPSKIFISDLITINLHGADFIIFSNIVSSLQSQQIKPSRDFKI